MQQLLRYISISLLIILWGAALPAFAAPTRLYGDVTVGMSGYRAEEEGVEVEKIASLHQQYTLGVEKNGSLGDSRFGNYTLMLGYEFNALNPERSVLGLRDPTVSAIQSSKLYYNASLLVAPGGLPFRLTLFANDLHRTQFVGGEVSRLGLGVQGESSSSGHMVTTTIPTDLSNGSHQIFGGTLLLGIRNGSYLGAYRDVLSQLPRLLIDYKQEDVEDSSSRFSPQHYRNRDLAFISLNKKDNWVHLRMRDFTDFLSPKNNTQSSSAMIGTIDHTLSRQWINLTNWIKISGDLSYSVDKEQYLPKPVNAYNVNLFTIIRRDHVSGSVLSSFERRSDGNALTYSSDVPVAMTMEPDRDTFIRSRFVYSAMQRNLIEGIVRPTEADGSPVNRDQFGNRDYYLDLSAELLRTRGVSYRPRFELESRDEGDNRRGLALRLGGEAVKNNVRRFGLEWTAGYALTTTQTEVGAASETYLQNELYGRIDRSLRETLRVGASSAVTIGSGGGRGAIGFRVPTMSREILGDGAANASSMVVQSTLGLYLDHSYQQLSNRLDLNHETISGSGIVRRSTTLRHSLHYSQPTQACDWQSELIFGDSSGSAAVPTTQFTAGTVSADELLNKTTWRSTANYTYTPVRSIRFRARGDISGGQETTSFVSEELAYRLFTTNGVVRQLAEFTEELGQERVSLAADGRNSSLYGRFSASYYPTKYIYAKLRNESVSYSGKIQQVNAAEAGLDFEKFKVLASFSEGHKDRESAALPAVMERRWDLKFKKIF